MIKAQNLANELGIITFAEKFEKAKEVQDISLGDPGFDSFFEGGLRPGYITEIYGEAGSGKSQICMQVMLNSLLDENKTRIEKKCYFVTTQKKLSEMRLDQLKNSFLRKHKIMNPKDLETHCINRHANTTQEFNSLLEIDLKNRLELKEKIRLIIIDSVAGICGEFVNNSQGIAALNLNSRSLFIKKIITTLKQYAYKFNIAVLITNNMTSSIGEDGDELKKEKMTPSLGLLWSNSINERIKVKKMKPMIAQEYGLEVSDIIKEKTKRGLSIKFSPRLPKKKCVFFIEAEGLRAI